MEISITTITENRRFVKALVRHSAAITALKQVADYANAFALPFDVLQIVFLDRDADYARAVGCKHDRIFQVEVPAPLEEIVDFADEEAFVACIAARLQTAIKLCGLPKQLEFQLSEAIAQYQ